MLESNFLQRKFMLLGVDGTIRELSSSIFTEDFKSDLFDSGIIDEEGNPNIEFILSQAAKLGFI